jgi:hypothetical protein
MLAIPLLIRVHMKQARIQLRPAYAYNSRFYCRVRRRTSVPPNGMPKGVKKDGRIWYAFFPSELRCGSQTFGAPSQWCPVKCVRDPGIDVAIERDSYHINLSFDFAFFLRTKILVAPLLCAPFLCGHLILSFLLRNTFPVRSFLWRPVVQHWSRPVVLQSASLEWWDRKNENTSGALLTFGRSASVMT